MIKKTLAQFAKEQNFIFYKPTILVRISRDTLQIVNFDVYAIGFDCKVAIQPLFLPNDSISLSLGNRLSHLGVHLPGIWGQGNEQEVVEDFEQVKGLLVRNALPWFEEVGHPKGIVNFLKDDNFEKNKDIIVGLPPFLRRLLLAMGYLYEENYILAKSELKIFYELAKDETKPWMLEFRKFANQITELIDTEDSSELTQHLQNIIQDTKSNLKLKIN